MFEIRFAASACPPLYPVRTEGFLTGAALYPLRAEGSLTGAAPLINTCPPFTRLWRDGGINTCPPVAESFIIFSGPALTSLGYSVREATRAVAAIPPDQKLALEEKIKLALQYFTAK